MTPQETLAAVRAAVIRAVPEIVELKFGCELSRKGQEDSRRPYKVIEDVGFGANDKKCWINSVPFGSMPIELEKDMIENGGEFKIVGRPIRLADVLLAILEPPDKKKKEEKWKNLRGFLEPYIHWDLRHDDLSLQPEETVAFIHGLLK
jgi:hypothetical protein